MEKKTIDDCRRKDIGDMKVFTTINPYGNFDAQKEAMISWSSKYELYSVNSASEIEIAKELYPEVSFIETSNTYQIGEKTLVKLDGILDAIKSTRATKCAIVNSDIILSRKINIDKKCEGSLVIATRWELGDVPSYPFESGYDLFIFDVRNIEIFYNKNYVIGMPWWDFWIPIIANKAMIPVYHIKNNLIRHRTHKTNYEHSTWQKFADYFYNDIKRLGGNWKIDEDYTKDTDSYIIEDSIFGTAIKKFIVSTQINIKSK